MLSDRQIELDSEFALIIDYEREKGEPTRVFRTMVGLIESCQNFDRTLMSLIDTRIEPLILLQDIQTDSLKSVLRTVGQASRLVPDDALKNLDIRPVFGMYFLMAKILLIDFTNGKSGIETLEDIQVLIYKLNELTDQTGVKMIPNYRPIKPKAVLDNLGMISTSMAMLEKGDKAMYASKAGNANFNTNFRLTEESIEDLVTKNALPSEDHMILQIKRPDFLGESMWDFKDGNTPIQVTFKDIDWLRKYQSREIDIRPQDSMEAMVRITRKYDYKDKLIAERYELLKVLNIRKGPEQSEMFEQP